MSEHRATVRWKKGPGEAFTDRRYTRVHEWAFDGGAVVRASASPHVVRAPMPDATAVDPEEAFIAALSSCHMLWFLDLAARRGVAVDAYEDEAAGWLTRMDDGRQVMSRVVLRPKVTLAGGQAPDRAVLDALH